MTLIVPDASVILAWVLQREDEPAFTSSTRLLEAYLAERVAIRLPTLWRYEVGNILGLKLRAQAIEAMDTLLAYQFPEETLSRGYCQAVLELMRTVKGISFYDGCYHSLAMRLGGTCVTADRGYVRRASDHGHLALVSDWRLPE